jgi:hypothetical protein
LLCLTLSNHTAICMPQEAVENLLLAHILSPLPDTIDLEGDSFVLHGSECDHWTVSLLTFALLGSQIACHGNTGRV